MTINPDFDKGDGLVPAIVQNADTGAVLMLGYMNAEALQVTRDKGLVTFFSRSKQRLWTKGETSNNTLELVDIKLDCDRDTLLVQARPNGPTCHLGDETCWGDNPPLSLGFLGQLQAIIDQRAGQSAETSYTAKLLSKGTLKCAQKVGEEGVETALAGAAESDELLLNEAADLLYHLTVLLKARDLKLADAVAILKDRHQAKD